jgi:hypothetical protein
MMETRKNEIRYVTSDPRRMLNRFIAKKVLKTWNEEFIDESTGKPTSIERNEMLFDKGTFIDKDTLSSIQFYMQAGDINEIEVSNQKRIATELKNTYLSPYLAQTQIKDKKIKFLFYASSIDMAMLVLKDYIELNYSNGFTLLMIKEFDSCIILTDTLKEKKIDDPSQEKPDDKEDDEEEDGEDKPDDRKFYEIEAKISYGEVSGQMGTFVVDTINVDRAMMIITAYLNKLQEDKEKEAKEHDREFEKQEIHAMVETSKILPLGRFIPIDFSRAYEE